MEAKPEATEYVKQAYPKVLYGVDGHRSVGNPDEDRAARKDGFEFDSPVDAEAAAKKAADAKAEADAKAASAKADADGKAAKKAADK